jgi:hypothetical protein
LILAERDRQTDGRTERDRQRDGRRDRETGERMDRQRDGRKDGQTERDRQRDRRKDGQTERQAKGWTDRERQTERQAKGWTDRGTDGRTNVPDRLRVTFCNFANEPKRKTFFWKLSLSIRDRSRYKILLYAIMFVISLNCIIDRNIHCRREQILEYSLHNVLLLMFHKEFMVTKNVPRCLINFQAFIV